jgi:hypothetical protein
VAFLEWVRSEAYERKDRGYLIRVTRVGENDDAPDPKRWKWRVAEYRTQDGHGGWAETFAAASVAAAREVSKVVASKRPRCSRRGCSGTAATAGLCASHYRGG